MLLKTLLALGFMAALVVVPGCGGSAASPSASYRATASPSPTSDPVAEYRALARRIDGMLRVHTFLQYCQPIQANTTSQCRASVVTLIAADKDALALVDGTAPPARFTTQHAALRAALGRDLVLANQALSAIDSQKDVQAALDAFGSNFNSTITPVLTEIDTA